MKIQAQVSLYPLKTRSLGRPIAEFCRRLQRPGLTVEVRSMDTSIVGESGAVFGAVEQAFQSLAAKYNVVMELKISNACPDVPSRTCKERSDEKQ